MKITQHSESYKWLNNFYQCLTWGQGVAGLSLTCVTVLCPWARHIYSCLVLVHSRKTRPDLTEKLLTDETKKHCVVSFSNPLILCLVLVQPSKYLEMHEICWVGCTVLLARNGKTVAMVAGVAIKISRWEVARRLQALWNRGLRNGSGVQASHLVSRDPRFDPWLLQSVKWDI